MPLTRTMANSAQAVALLGVVALPMLALTVRGGANTSYFLMLLAAVLGGLSVALSAPTQAQPYRPFWRQHWPLAVALGLPVLAVLWSQFWLGDWTGRPYDGLSRLLLAMPIAWWLSQLPIERLRVWQWAVGAGAVLGCWVLVQSIAPGETRPEPSYATAITFGNLTLLMGVFAALSLAWRQTRSWLEPVVKGAAALIGLYGSFLSQSRGGWLALPVIIAVLILVARISWRIKAGLAILTVAGLGLVYMASSTVQERVALVGIELNDYRQGENLESSIAMRLQFWQASWEMLREAPWTGVGSQNINAEFRVRVEQGRMAPLGVTYDHSHNETFWFMASWGVPGWIALWLVYGVPLVYFVRVARLPDRARAAAGRMGLVLVVGYMVFGLTEAMFAITMNAAFYAGTLAILVGLAQPRRRASDASSALTSAPRPL